MTATRTPGLTRVQQRRLKRALGMNHAIRIDVTVMTHEHDVTASISHMFVGGQVDYKAEGRTGWDRSSSAIVELFDPDHELDFDTDRPGQGQMFLDRMVGIVYAVHVAEEPDPQKRWYEVPVFTGPIVDGNREGDTFTVICQGKEHLAKRSAYGPIHYQQGGRRTTAIRRLMVEHAGESADRVSVPSQRPRLARNMTIAARSNTIWSYVVRLGNSLNQHSEYDALGVYRLEDINNNLVAAFRDGKTAEADYPANVLSDVKAGYDIRDIVNVVKVFGATLKALKRPARGSAWPKVDDPLNPHNMGRNGTPRHLQEVVDNSDARTDSEAQDEAEERLQGYLTSYVTATFECLPDPTLRAWDLGSIFTRDVKIPFFRVSETTLPLVHDGVQTVGARRLVRTRRRRNRR